MQERSCLCKQIKSWRKSVIEADIINADGKAIVWAANLLGHKLPERVSGIDLMEELVSAHLKKDINVSFLEQQKRW